MFVNLKKRDLDSERLTIKSVLFENLYASEANQKTLAGNDVIKNRETTSKENRKKFFENLF